MLESRFLLLDENLTSIHGSHTQTQSFKLSLFDLVTLDNHDLTQGNQRLRRVPESIHALSSVLFKFDTAALPCEASDGK